MKKNKILLSVIASFVILTSTAFALITPTYEVSYDIGKETTLTKIAGLNNLSPQKINIIEYSPNTSVTPMVFYNDQVYNSNIDIITATQMLEDDGYTIIAGINADSYSPTHGVSNGLIMADGKLISSDSFQYAVAFKDDNTIFIDKPNMQMSMEFYNGSLDISYFNKVRTTAGIYLLDENFNNETTNTAPGLDIILERLNFDPITPNCSVKFRVVDVIETSDSTEILENQLILTVRDELVDFIPDVVISEDVTLNISTINTDWNDVKFAVGATNLILKDGTIQADLSTVVEAKTALGVKADGSVVIYQVDSFEESYSVGMNESDVAKELIELGCVDAVTLDSGNSSSLVAKMPGNDSPSLQNSPTTGELAQNANYIMFINQRNYSGSLTNLHIYPSNHLMLLNSEISIDVVASDNNFYNVNLTNEILTANGYEVIGGTYYADEIGEVELLATRSNITETSTVKVLDFVDNIVVSTVDNYNVSQIDIKPSNQIQLFPSATHEYLNVTSSIDSFDFAVEGNIGTITDSGLFIAKGAIGDGKIIVSYNGTSFTEIDVSVGISKESEVSYVLNEKSYFETEDMIFNAYEIKNKPFKQYGIEIYDTTSVRTNSVDITGFSYLNFNFISDYNKVFAVFINENGNEILAALNIIDESTFVTIDIPTDVTHFVGFDVLTGYDGSLMFENITLSTEYNDLTPPLIDVYSEFEDGKFDVIYLEGKVYKEGNIALEKENISVFLNGVSVKFTYDEFSGAIYVESSNLIDGLNKLTITAYDNFSNFTIKNVAIYSTSNYENTFVDTDNHWAKDYINFNHINEIINGSIVDDISYFYPSNNITRAEFAVMISRFLDLSVLEIDEAEIFFDDNDIPSWAYDAVYAVKQAGIMNGATSEGNLVFNPSNYMTRAETFTVLGRILTTGNIIIESEFIDAENIPSWAFEYFNILYTFDIINGYDDNSIKPLNNVTRAEVCKLLYSIA